MDTATSINNVPIRLTPERWLHIVETHDDIAGYYDSILLTIEGPDYIIKGHREAMIALKHLTAKKYLAVVYKKLQQKIWFHNYRFYHK